MKKDYYTLLGVSRSATAAEIQKAYRKLARKYHPDVNKASDAADIFKSINEAHNVLSDQEKRRLYDQYGEDWENAKLYEKSRRKAGTDDRYNSSSSFHFEGGDAEDFFSSLFGKGRRADGGWSYRVDRDGDDVEAEITVHLSELASGCKKTLSWQVGRAGTRPDAKKVEVNIPKGLKDGSVIRLAEMGGEPTGTGRKGDLLLRVRVAPDPRFAVSGYNLQTTVPLTPWEAVLGGKVSVQTLQGEITLTVPQNCQNGRTLRVRGKGLPKKDATAGDLFVTLEIRIPDDASEKEKELFMKLAKASSFNPRTYEGQKATMRDVA